MNMKKLFFVGILTCLSFSPYYKCEGIKKGTFKTVDEMAGTTFVYRNDSVQIEKNNTLGILLFQKIKWLDDCTYRISSIKAIEDKNNMNLKPGDFTVRLEKVNDSLYNQIVRVESMNFEHTSKTVKISDKIDEKILKLIKENLK